ncbi:MAG: septation protein SpoVG family protein [Planctomycetes bacterium]|nr:septation protein SpoVG family protein [Planctomycetota bacterium]
MNHVITITDLQFTRAPRLHHIGIIGFVRCTANGGLALDGIAVRRRAEDGRLTLSFPARKDERGKLHHHFHPIDDATRIEIERQILDGLGLNNVEATG